MKRNVSFLMVTVVLIATMIFSSFAVVNAAAVQSFSFGAAEIDATTENIGETIKVPVVASAFPADVIYAGQLDITFDKDVLQIESIVEGIKGKDVDGNDVTIRWYNSDLINYANQTGSASFAFIDTDRGASKKYTSAMSGTLFTIVFKILDDSNNTEVSLNNAIIHDFSNGSDFGYNKEKGDLEVSGPTTIKFTAGIIEIPEEPTTPDVKPDDKPDTPSVPENPVTPETPEVPETPVTPDVKPEVNDVAFTDLEGFEWAKDSIAELVNKKVVNGKSETSFAPADNVTRAEFAKLIVAAFDLKAVEGKDSNFTDIKDTDWFASYVDIAVANGIVTGYPDNTFNPNANITRQEMCVMLERALKSYGLTTAQSNFADAAEISDWAMSAVNLLSANGIINGRGENMFVPEGTATRAESAVAIYRTLKAIGK